jgi:hypothetical protein
MHRAVLLLLLPLLLLLDLCCNGALLQGSVLLLT